MLKKSLLISSLCAITLATSIVFANNVLTVKPSKPSSWAYKTAFVSINSEEKQIIDSIRTLVSGVSDDVSLIEVIYGNGIHPKIDTSCQNIQVLGQGEHLITFKLKNDGLIHCQYSLIPEYS